MLRGDVIIIFMYGVNGIIGAYALASQEPLALLNAGMALVMLAVAYVLFMRKFYHLHEEYLRRVRGESITSKS